MKKHDIINDPYLVIKHPLATEKSIRQMEANNTLGFAVDPRANKVQIKSAVEQAFKVKVVKVNTLVVGGDKHAYVKFHKDSPAIDVATALGLM